MFVFNRMLEEELKGKTIDKLLIRSSEREQEVSPKDISHILRKMTVRPGERELFEGFLKDAIVRHQLGYQEYNVEVLVVDQDRND